MKKISTLNKQTSTSALQVQADVQIPMPNARNPDQKVFYVNKNPIGDDAYDKYIMGLVRSNFDKIKTGKKVILQEKTDHELVEFTQFRIEPFVNPKTSKVDIAVWSVYFTALGLVWSVQKPVAYIIVDLNTLEGEYKEGCANQNQYGTIKKFKV